MWLSLSKKSFIKWFISFLHLRHATSIYHLIPCIFYAVHYSIFAEFLLASLGQLIFGFSITCLYFGQVFIILKWAVFLFIYYFIKHSNLTFLINVKESIGKAFIEKSEHPEPGQIIAWCVQQALPWEQTLVVELLVVKHVHIGTRHRLQHSPTAAKQYRRVRRKIFVVYYHYICIYVCIVDDFSLVNQLLG